MQEYIDKAAAPRTGEELDREKIKRYLLEAVPGLSGEFEISQFPSGFSNLTYFIKFGEREMVLRRPPFGRKAKSAHDMGREFRMLSALKPVYPYCPAPLAYSEDESVMGCPFYVMERIKGIILRKNVPRGLNLGLDGARALCRELVDVQVALHKVDYRAAGLESYGKPEGYVERQVTGWSRRYRDALTPNAPDFERVMEWLKEKRPPDSPHVAVIHNDYKFDNVVLDPSNPLKIIGVLDWEMATIGDPLMDLGSSIAYWVEETDPENMKLIRMLPTNMPGAMSRREIIDYYSARTGIEAGKFDFYFCFGLFRLAVIAQQIYYRFYHGQTKDQRFGLLILATKVLEEAALQVIDASRL